MEEKDYRPVVLVIVLIMMLVLVVAIAAHFAIRHMISRAVQKVAAAQLQKDAAALRAGRPLQQINASKAATSKVLLQALCAKV